MNYLDYSILFLLFISFGFVCFYAGKKYFEINFNLQEIEIDTFLLKHFNTVSIRKDGETACINRPIRNLIYEADTFYLCIDGLVLDGHINNMEFNIDIALDEISFMLHSDNEKNLFHITLYQA